MADTNTTNEPIFSAFEWGHEGVNAEGVTIPGRVFAKLVNQTRDITHGVATIMEILERDMLSEDADEPCIFRGSESSVLMRLAIRSAHMLRDETERLTDWAYKYQTPEGRKEHAAAWNRTTQRQAA